MLKKFSLLFLVCSTAILTSCGGGDIGGGVGEFTTVNATATATNNNFESDIVTDNICTAGVQTTPGTVKTDNVDVDFTSKSQFTTGALNLAISKITIHYTPAPGGTVPAPALPDSYVNFSDTVAPNATVTIPVPILTRDQKLDLLNRATQAMPVCTGTTFRYYVDIIFEVSEPGGNGQVKPVTAKTTLDVADSQ
ncbi:hypothetical protein KP001_02780 [Geomonas subterranea]|uniref:Lipoprotein n=1 Tax=Geomonas subterranea TaxID=2847989 RepID=A0ABX8LJ40_9BACT|nr:hypothetical protein [Geomonas subterranea]QXE91489.1 hypothetical protein KP001_02780 [Geomonas subterranea]QXM10423.1 hypothetical protein KP002_04715 [Geomonas subterranea]